MQHFRQIGHGPSAFGQDAKLDIPMEEGTQEPITPGSELFGIAYGPAGILRQGGDRQAVLAGWHANNGIFGRLAASSWIGFSRFREQRAKRDGGRSGLRPPVLRQRYERFTCLTFCFY